MTISSVSISENNKYLNEVFPYDIYEISLNENYFEKDVINLELNIHTWNNTVPVIEVIYFILRKKY